MASANALKKLDRGEGLAGKEEPTASLYLDKIICSLQVSSSTQRRVVSFSALIGGGSAFFAWGLAQGVLTTLWPIYLMLSVFLTYLGIGFTIVLVGQVIHCRRFHLLVWPEDPCCSEDVSEILDLLTCLFVPITIAMVSLAGLTVVMLGRVLS